MTKPLEFCWQGHAMTGYNRMRARGKVFCRECSAESAVITRTLVPAAPLLAALERQGISIKAAGRIFGQRLGIQAVSVEKALNRAVATGTVTIATADEYAIAMGLHPFDIYGEAWFTYGAREVANAV